MRRLTPEHYVLLAGFLAVLGLQLGHAKNPQFWGGIFAQAALLLRAMFSKQPSVY